MIEYIPISLKDELLNAIDVLPFLEGEIQGIELRELKNYEEDDVDILINKDTDILLYIDDYNVPQIDVKKFVNMAKDKKEFKINEAQSYAKSEQEVYFLLEPSDPNVLSLLDNTFNELGRPNCAMKLYEIINGKNYKVSLFSGFCVFNLLVVESGKYNEYCPGYSPYDFFVRVQCDEGIDMRVADTLANAYVFELQATLDIQLPFSTGRVDINPSDWSDESLQEKENMLFPLVLGNGTKELLSLYNTAKTTYDLDFKILGFTKVIEYIAPTISQKTLIESITFKLSSAEVLKPTTAYIFSLGAIYDKNRNMSTKDSELIKLSVLNAVTVEDIWEFVPDFIKSKQTTIPKENEEQNDFLVKVSESIYNTRNEIAHAKANYEKKGTECPLRFKEEFCRMLDVIAVRCIRWFAMQPEDRRVVLK